MTDRRFLTMFVVLLFGGLMNILRMIGRPGLENVRSVDVVFLIGTGMCLGGAIVALAAAVVRPRHT